MTPHSRTASASRAEMQAGISRGPIASSSISIYDRTNEPSALGQALVEFTTSGAVSEEGIADTALTSNELPPAIHALA